MFIFYHKQTPLRFRLPLEFGTTEPSFPRLPLQRSLHQREVTTRGASARPRHEQPPGAGAARRGADRTGPVTQAARLPVGVFTREELRGWRGLLRQSGTGRALEEQRQVAVSQVPTEEHRHRAPAPGGLLRELRGTASACPCGSS